MPSRVLVDITGTNWYYMENPIRVGGDKDLEECGGGVCLEK